MNKRLPRADKKLIIPGGDKSPGKAPEKYVLPGKDIKAGGNDPTIVLEPGIREITATTLAEEHQGVKQVHKEVVARDDTEDWGGGMSVFPEFAHVLRGPDGAITSVVPLSEIPGVEMTERQEEAKALIADAKETPVAMTRDERHKFISILTTRMFKYYHQLARDYPGFHPFRDGIPDLPAGAPKNLAPLGEKLYPATDAQIYQWLYKTVGARATVVNKRKHGSGIQDMAVRIE
jgi:hypothetical protein